MHDYRVYLLDEQDKIRKARWVHCDSLGQAVVQVSTEMSEITCEIWDGPRLLAPLRPSMSTTPKSNTG